MKTITLQIGNTDDKLTQSEWAGFIKVIQRIVSRFSSEIHFFGTSANDAPWQNAAWVVSCEERNIRRFQNAISEARQEFDQDSVAWTEGTTEFI